MGSVFCERDWMKEAIDRSGGVSRISSALDVSPSIVYRWISGKATPSLESAIRLAIIVGPSLYSKFEEEFGVKESDLISPSYSRSSKSGTVSKKSSVQYAAGEPKHPPIQSPAAEGPLS